MVVVLVVVVVMVIVVVVLVLVVLVVVVMIIIRIIMKEKLASQIFNSTCELNTSASCQSALWLDELQM
jgi:hypothetical protein